jgi:hypothetical protein
MAFDWLLVTTLTSACLAGLLLPLFANVASPLGPHLGVDEKFVRRLQLLFSVALVPLMLVTGQVIDKWDNAYILYETVALGGLLAAAGCGTLAMRRSQRAAAVATILLAAGVACVVTAATMLMPHAFFGADQPVAGFNLGYLVLGSAVVVSGPLQRVFERRIGLDRCLLIFGLLALACGALAGLHPQTGLERLNRGALVSSFFADPRLGLACLIVLFYFPLEGSLGTWAHNYLRDLDCGGPRVLMWMAVFWVAYLAMRGVGVFIDARAGDFYLLCCVAVIAIAYGNLTGAGPSSGTQGMLLMWAAHGPVWPTLLGVILPRAHSPATAFAVLFSIGTLGSIAFQPALVKYARSHSVRETMRIPMLLALLLAVPTAFLAFL